jgi:5-methylcytosine-specific restriction endonuclease McrA
MRSRTPKRAKQEIEYKKICDEIDEEAKTAGKFECFFCGKPIKGRPDHHHALGREGELLTDKENILISHPLCHQQYHDLPIRKQPWRDIFLKNLREKNLRLYFKEREKENK